jgi:hypothetical protein
MLERVPSDEPQYKRIGVFWFSDLTSRTSWFPPAIKRLNPAARVGEADRIAPPGGVGKRRDDDDIGARVEPAVVGDDSVLVVDVESTHIVAAQGGLIPTEAD